MAKTSFDVIVVGGGIVGSTLAFTLARRGQSVALVERGKIGCGTSSRSFTWINATSKVADESYHRLNALGADLYRALGQEFGDSSLGLHPCGMLQCTSRADPVGFKAMAEQAERLADFGYPSRIIEADELRALEPKIALADEACALFATADSWLETGQFLPFLSDQSRALGAEIFEDCAARELMLTDDGSISGLQTDAGPLEAAKVVVAVGPDTSDVLSELTGYEAFASRFPMSRVPGLLVTTPDSGAEPFINHILYYDNPIDPLHLRPAGNGGLLLGSDDTDGMVNDESSEQALQIAARTVLRRTKTLIPAFDGESCLEDCQIAVGIRAYPQDGKTLAGPFPGADGLYLMATHSGITLAPALGQLMAETIIENHVPAELEPFSLTRFPGFA